MISAKTTKTERLRNEMKIKKIQIKDKTKKVTSRVKIKPTEIKKPNYTIKISLNKKQSGKGSKLKNPTKMENNGKRGIAKQSIRPKRTQFKRKCSKVQPLEPTKTGIKKPTNKKETNNFLNKSIAKKSVRVTIKPKHKIKLKTKKKQTSGKMPEKKIEKKTENTIEKKTIKKQEKKTYKKSEKKTSRDSWNIKLRPTKTQVEDNTGEPKPKAEEVIFNPTTGCIACVEGRQGEGDQNYWACRLRRLQNIQDILPWNRQETEN